MMMQDQKHYEEMEKILASFADFEHVFEDIEDLNKFELSLNKQTCRVSAKLHFL